MADSYTASYANVYYFAMALGVIPIIAGLCMRDFDCYLTDHVAHQLYDRKNAHQDMLEGDSESQPSPTIHSITENKNERYYSFPGTGQRQASSTDRDCSR
jgi:hypothetical protein